MLTSLSAREVRLLCAAMSELAEVGEGASLRRQFGERLLDLFDADYFASFVWQPETGRFGECVALNMDPTNLANYDAYYQFHDPITWKLQKRLRATHVNEVMPQAELERTEFFNDFLARDGLHFGMNFYAYDGIRNIGDVRIWRRRGRANFDRREVDLLNAIGPAFARALKSARRLAQERCARQAPDWRETSRAYGLTARETEVVRAAATGLRDREIAEELAVSLATVRSHLRSAFAKLSVRTRAELAARFGRPGR